MPAVAGDPQIFVAWPHRLRIWGLAIATVLCVLTAVGWFALPAELRDLFSLSQRLTLLALLALLVGLLPATRAAGAEAYGLPRLLATLADGAVAESSGLVASRRAPAVLWTHNDSGDGPILYATDRAGRALATLAVVGADNVDWEDLAAGPGAEGGDALYVAETGDNRQTRAGIVIYRVEEPAIAAAAGRPLPPAAAERFPVAYPDGPRNAEALLVHPLTGEILLVTKEPFRPAGVYRVPMPLTLDRTATLERITDLPLPGFGPARAVTGGAVAPDGTRLALRTPVAAYEWAIAPGATLADALAGTPTRLPLPPSRHGEAIAYRADGAAFLLTSEGNPCPLSEMPRE